MSAKILKKISGLAVALAVGIIAFSFFYTLQLSRAKDVSLQKSFYFLVSTDSRVEVGAQFARLDGGAGYLLQDGESQCVAWSVYLKEEDGKKVQEGLQEEFSTELLHKGVRTLYFKGVEKKRSSLYLNALRTLEGYISVLNECISRLEKGATQESCKRILAILQRQFSYAEGEYEGYPAFSKACGEWSQALYEIQEETIYVKDLRYLLCWQVEKYLQLCEGFML